jgi:hypothetical protein
MNLMGGRATIAPDVVAPEEAGRAEAADLAVALARIKKLIETSAVEEARALAKDMGERWPDDRAPQQWARVLAPPRGRLRQISGEQ